MANTSSSTSSSSNRSSVSSNAREMKRFRLKSGVHAGKDRDTRKELEDGTPNDRYDKQRIFFPGDIIETEDNLARLNTPGIEPRFELIPG